MIALLNGRVDALEDGRCIIDVNGVGYLVQASTRTLASLPPAPAVARVLVETHVRDDAITLYGFTDTAERDWFRLLLTVQGVGAKVALGILSSLSPRDLIGAIAAGDKTSLTRAPGVGAKLAVRLLSELRDKAGAMPTGTSIAFAAPAGGTEARVPCGRKDVAPGPPRGAAGRGGVGDGVRAGVGNGVALALRGGMAGGTGAPAALSPRRASISKAESRSMAVSYLPKIAPASMTPRRSSGVIGPTRDMGGAIQQRSTTRGLPSSASMETRASPTPSSRITVAASKAATMP